MPPKRGRPSSAERLERHERVIDVVVGLLAAHGYEAVTFDRVSADAHVAKRTLYTDFGDRVGLVRAAVRRQHAYLDRAWSSADDLRAASVAVVTHLLGDEAIAVHRALVADAASDAALAAEFYDEGPGRAQAFLARFLPTDAVAPPDLVFTALLGEGHRRRMLGLEAAPASNEVTAHVDRTLAALGLARPAELS